MSLIFFDLETSDKNPCGQILNYSFIRTDNNFEVSDELSGEISLSILQIPSPGALLTNRIKILDHQTAEYPREPEALLAIARFIADSIEISKEPVILIGFNSTKFDLPFLRTSFIRNGINPYFSGKLAYQDLLHIVRKAFVLRLDFPMPTKAEEKTRLSLSLEACCKAHNLLETEQTHHSRDDVLLTIKFAKTIAESYGLHPCNFKAYEPASNLDLAGYVTPNYELETMPYSRELLKPYGLLSENYRAALWIDLERYKNGEGKKAISYFNKNTAQFIKHQSPIDNKYLEILAEARQELSKISPDNFFEKSTCDIEQDIYRLDFQKINLLTQIIWNNERDAIKEIKDKDLQTLISRYWLAYGGNKNSPKWQEKLREYFHYRYMSGEFQLTKSIPEDSTDERQVFHPSLTQINQEIETAQKEFSGDPGKIEIIRQLQDYIAQHPFNIGV